MRAGDLRHQISFEQASEWRDATGQQIQYWGTVLKTWAAIWPLRGKEYLAAKQLQSTVTHKIRVRYQKTIGTNLIHYSHQLGNVASGGWWADNLLTSVTANGMLAPDGNVVADGLVGTAANADHRLNTPIISGIAQSDKVALTVFGEIGNKNWVKLRLAFYDIGDVYLNDVVDYYFDISTGTIGSPIEGGNATIHSYMIEEAANGFYRIGIIASNANVNTAKVGAVFYSAHADNDTDFPGDTTTVNTWFWGADLAKQEYFGYHIPTSGAIAPNEINLNPRHRIKFGTRYFSINSILNPDRRNIMLDMMCTEEV